MKITKLKIADLKDAYSISFLKDAERNYGVAASSMPGECYCFPIDNPQNVERVWSGFGGTMSLSQYNQGEDFFATRNFFKAFDCKTAYVVRMKKESGVWNESRLFNLPFLHRFEVIEIEGRKFLLGATLCEDKDFKDDWTKPGSVYLGEIVSGQEKEIKLKQIITGLTKNHGFYMGNHHGERVVLIGTANGLIELVIPRTPDGEWNYSTLIENEVSDSCLVDLDNDGEDEIVTIEGFHGNTMFIYKLINGKYERVYEFPVDFGHALWGGRVFGENGFFMAYRRGNGPLIWFTKKQCDGFYMEQTYIDENVGPANFAVMNEDDKCTILAACGGSHEIKMYKLEK